LKQHERKIKQNKQSGTKNVEQNDAKNLFESKKKKWKGREIKLFVSYEAKKLYFCFLKNVKRSNAKKPICSVADPDPGSGAFLTPGSEIGLFRIPDLGSQTHIFESLVTIFWIKTSLTL
jgi:hypothetical protein